jgi:hypothetical protein
MELYALSQLLILMAASLVLSSPTSLPVEARTSTIGGSLGDGYYRVSNDNNITNLVSFIPIAEVPHHPATTADANRRMALEERALGKDEYPRCTSWTLNADDTLNAQECLRNAAQSELEWRKDHWAFVSTAYGQTLDLPLMTLCSAKLVGLWLMLVLIQITSFVLLPLIIWS